MLALENKGLRLADRNRKTAEAQSANQTDARKDPVDVDWSSEPLADLIGHILTDHHARMMRTLPLISELLAGSPAGAPPNLARAFAQFRRELEYEMRVEELVLFPIVVQMESDCVPGKCAPGMPFGRLDEAADVLHHDHTRLAETLGEMRLVTGFYAVPQGAGRALRSLYRELSNLDADFARHSMLEDEILIPRALAMQPKRPAEAAR